MSIEFGREICGDLNVAETREWLVTNGIGSYASGTVGGLLTRCYHGLLVAALKPPLGRTLLLTKIDETADYDGQIYPLFTNRWANNIVDPNGHWHIESFHLEGTIPVWRFAFGDALLEKRIWMQRGVNTTYVRYDLLRGTRSLTLSLKALVNYRDYHSRTQSNGWQMSIDPVKPGVCVKAFPGAVPFYLLTDSGEVFPADEWNCGFDLAAERDRGLYDKDDNLCVANFKVTIEAEGFLTFVATTDKNASLNSAAALDLHRTYEQQLLECASVSLENQKSTWVNQLILAADQFIVNRPLPDDPDGKTIIAGYHWFSDWGRDTMISLPGLTLSTNRKEIARSIIRTFSKYVSRGMLPNRFPDDGTPPAESEYNTVDATLWYFEAIRLYHATTGDDNLLGELFPVLAEIVDWHRRGTRYNIHLDSSDGLIYAGEKGVQLTWMDAKVGDWVVTPRRGKPVEINALWYNALRTMSNFAYKLQKPHEDYDRMAEATLKGFGRFWNDAVGYCFDVLDTPEGNDASLRPNQIFAVSLPESPLSLERQRSVVEICGRSLLTSYGLRSLAPDNPHYLGNYAGFEVYRDGAYHQGTVWGWLLGSYVLAHLRVFKDPIEARKLLEPMKHHLLAAGVGTISEIFNGDAPIQPQGCIAQAWSVAEFLRAWLATEKNTGGESCQPSRNS
ncbi:MAG TPA: amylo-alpha-1,6-glucosidase [Candidatus Obscuribacterales bacterium]